MQHAPLEPRTSQPLSCSFHCRPVVGGSRVHRLVGPARRHFPDLERRLHCAQVRCCSVCGRAVPVRVAAAASISAGSSCACGCRAIALQAIRRPFGVHPLRGSECPGAHAAGLPPACSAFLQGDKTNPDDPYRQLGALFVSSFYEEEWGAVAMLLRPAAAKQSRCRACLPGRQSSAAPQPARHAQPVSHTLAHPAPLQTR